MLANQSATLPQVLDAVLDRVAFVRMDLRLISDEAPRLEKAVHRNPAHLKSVEMQKRGVGAYPHVAPYRPGRYRAKGLVLLDVAVAVNTSFRFVEIGEEIGRQRLQCHLTRDLHIPVRIYDNGRGFTVSYTPMINAKAKVEIPLRLRWVIQAALPRHDLRRFEFSECL